MILLVIAVVALGVVISMGYVWVLALIVFGSIAIVLAFLLKSAWGGAFRHIAWFSGTENLKWADCHACNGWGEVALQWSRETGTTEWMPIPPDGTFAEMSMPLNRANTKPCPTCQGLGHRWTGRDDGPAELPYAWPR